MAFLDDATIPILINNNNDITEFEFEISGANVKRAFGGITEELGFEISLNNNKIQCKSKNKTTIPRGGGQKLIFIELEPNVRIDFEYNSSRQFGFPPISPSKMRTSICIEDIILTNNLGYFIENVYESYLNCTLVKFAD